MYKGRADTQSLVYFILLVVLLSVPSYLIVRSLYFPFQEDLIIKGSTERFLLSSVMDEIGEEAKGANSEETEANTSEGEGGTTGSGSGESSLSGEWWEYPDNIKETTKDGDDLLVLVNKEYQLASSYVPSNLVLLDANTIRVTKSNLYVRSSIVDSLRELNDAAENAGIDLSVLSAYRSYSSQDSTYQYWVSYNGGDVSAADTVSARPGHSQHQLGTTVDFSSSEIGDALGSQFGDTEASSWLEDNAYKYGFVISYPEGSENETGYSYEPWHYRFIGKDNANSWKNSGEILEVWLR